MKIEFLLLPEYGEQSEQKWNKSPCSTRCGKAALQRGFGQFYIAKGLLLYSRMLGIISRQPCPRIWKVALYDIIYDIT